MIHKLKDELTGILNLALRAYLNAVNREFTEPSSMEVAKKEWRLEADQVAQFVEDCCERKSGARETSSDVFQAYKSWAQKNGINRLVTHKSLRDRLTSLGFAAARDSTARYVVGIRVKKPDINRLPGLLRVGGLPAPPAPE
ncbi:hypothetical protein HGD85_03765 [Rhodobacteraceae bacterium R_SAG10]|nr:hypothetical protein [Rhodobacteraceae bacterium R_SAG10]